MPKLSAEGSPNAGEIIRVEITSQTLNEKNEDGTWKFSDDQLRDWLTKLRGDREVTVAKKMTRDASNAKREKVVQELTDDDITDE